MIRTGTGQGRSAEPTSQDDTKRCNRVEGAFKGSASWQHWVGRSDDIMSGGIPASGLSGGASLIVGGRGPVRIRGIASATPGESKRQESKEGDIISRRKPNAKTDMSENPIIRVRIELVPYRWPYHWVVAYCCLSKVQAGQWRAVCLLNHATPTSLQSHAYSTHLSRYKYESRTKVSEASLKQAYLQIQVHICEETYHWVCRVWSPLLASVWEAGLCLWRSALSWQTQHMQKLTTSIIDIH